jgi:hypothetical protein
LTRLCCNAEVQSKEIVAAPEPEGETVDKYSIHEPQVESLIPEPEPVVDEAPLPEPAIPAIPEQNLTEMEPEQPQPSLAPAPASASEPEPEIVVEPLLSPAQSQAPSPSQENVMAAVSVEAPVPEPESVPVAVQSRDVEPFVLGEQPKLSYASVVSSEIYSTLILINVTQFNKVLTALY